MNPDLRTRMERNVKLFGIYKTFTKRVFLPMTTIYASQVAGLDVSQIGIAAAAGSLVSIAFETTTGYWADRHGRKQSARVGAGLAFIGTACYIAMPNFIGIVAASVITSVGYSFLSGSIDALVHDSLMALGRDRDYAKAASRAQSFSLILNALFVATVPLLYPINPTLPFFAGLVAYGALFAIASLLSEPPVPHSADQAERRFLHTVQRLLTRRTVAFFATAGLMAAIVTGLGDIFNLGLLKLGMQPHYLGTVFAAASVLGAALGMVIHHLKRLSFHQYASLDLVVNATMFIAFGLLRSLTAAVVVFICNMALWRFQRIMYQHYMLEIYGTTRYKATLLSLISNFGIVHEVWLALAFSQLAHVIGILPSLSYGAVLALAAWPVLLVSISQFTANAAASARSKNQ